MENALLIKNGKLKHIETIAFLHLNPCNQFTRIDLSRVCLLKAEILMSRKKKKIHAQYICQTHSCGEKNLINTPCIFPEAHRTENICLAAEPCEQRGHTHVLE